MTPPTDTDPKRFVTWGELKFMMMFVFTAGFLLGAICHDVFTIWRSWR